MPGHGETDQAKPAARAPRRSDAFGWDSSDLLPDVTSDERDHSWGNDRGSTEDPDLRRFLDEKPPHHL